MKNTTYTVTLGNNRRPPTGDQFSKQCNTLEEMTRIGHIAYSTLLIAGGDTMNPLIQPITETMSAVQTQRRCPIFPAPCLPPCLRAG